MRLQKSFLNIHKANINKKLQVSLRYAVCRHEQDARASGGSYILLLSVFRKMHETF